ncbi:MAG: FkbM family methyltransferase [Leeuwenhoekiella sp.]
MFKAIKYFFKNRRSAKRKKILGPYAKGVIYETENGIIALPTQDIAMGKALGFKGEWDIDEIKIITRLINYDDVIYIVGTHVGTLLVPIVKIAGKIVGYEANHNTFDFMQMNIQLNALENVKLFNNAVGDAFRTVSFYQNTVNTGGSKIKPVSDVLSYTYDNPKKVQVDMIMLDDHISIQDLPTPKGLLMDIEGAEYYALKGMQKTMGHLRFFYMEFVPHHLKNVSNVTIETFAALLCPHFNTAQFLKSDKTISIAKKPEIFIAYLKELTSRDQADDILFTK